MALLRQGVFGWEGSFRFYVQHKTGKPKARIRTQANPWSEIVVLCEGDGEAVADVGFALADVLNSAVEHKPSLAADAGFAACSAKEQADAVLKAVALDLLNQPKYSELFNSFVDLNGVQQSREETVQEVTATLQRLKSRNGVFKHLLEFLEHAESSNASGATSNTAQGTGPLDTGGQPLQQQQQQQQDAAAAAGGSLGADADPAAAAAAAARRKRAMTESQVASLAGKTCTGCGMALECARKTCRECGAKQVPKAVRQRTALMEPIVPYSGSGALPRLQDSTQALANVSKRFEDPALLKQLRAVSEDTGLEVMVLGMGFVKCGAQYSPLEQQHESGMYVMGVKTTAPDHRLVLASSSTGGALRSAMDTPCSIAGLTAAQIPARVLRMCAAKQHILALAQLAMVAPGGEGLDGAHADGAAAAAGVAGGPAAAAAAASTGPSAAAVGETADGAAAAARGVAGGASAGEAQDAAATAAAAAEFLLPPAAGTLMFNQPADPMWVVNQLQVAGHVMIPGAVSLADMSLCQAVVDNGQSAFPIVRRGSGQQAHIVSIATGNASIYSVTDRSGTRIVSVPQVIEVPHHALSAEVLEQVLSAEACA